METILIFLGDVNMQKSTKKNINWGNGKLPVIISSVIISLALLLVFSFQGVKNKAISYEEQIQAAQSDIKVQEKRRGDLLPNLVDCVKQYDKHEYETLMAVVEARGSTSDESVAEIKTMIQAVAEAYPDLKSNENYGKLMIEMATTENLISNYRSAYNKWVKTYNRYVRKFPNEQILSLIGYELIDYTYLDYEVPEDAPTNMFGE